MRDADFRIASARQQPDTDDWTNVCYPTISFLARLDINSMINALTGSSPVVLISRMLIAAVVVIGSYNPSGSSVYHWVSNNENPTDAWVVLGAIVAILLNLALLIAAWKTLGKVGTLIVVIFFAALVYLSLQEGWVDSGNNASLQWLALILYSGFLGIGLSGAIIWRRVTGQVITDEAGDIDD